MKHVESFPTRQIRFAFVSEHYPPTDGGVATSTQRVARSLQRAGASVRVLCFDHSRPVTSPDYVVSEVDSGVDVFRIGPFFLKQPSLSADRVPEKVKATLRRRAFGQMCQLLSANPVDVVLSFYLLNAGFMGQFLARAQNVPFVAGVRGNDIGRNIFNVERFGVTQWVVQGADRVVCVNQHLRSRLLLAFPEASGKVSVVPNSVSIPPLAPGDRASARRVLLKTFGWGERDLILIFIGTLREKKGVEPLLKALDMVRTDRPVRLLVVGPKIGSLERATCGDLWEKLVAEGRCCVTGRVPHEEVGKWAQGGDIVIMPSLDDGLANGLLEGMALGLCPIATNVFDDVIRDGVNGKLVPPGDPQQLADAIRSLAQDDARLIQFGDAARSGLRAWSPADEAAAYLKVARRLMPSAPMLAESRHDSY